MICILLLLLLDIVALETQNGLTYKWIWARVAPTTHENILATVEGKVGWAGEAVMVKACGKTGTELEEGLDSAEAQLPARRGHLGIHSPGERNRLGPWAVE